MKVNVLLDRFSRNPARGHAVYFSMQRLSWLILVVAAGCTLDLAAIRGCPTRTCSGRAPRFARALAAEAWYVGRAMTSASNLASSEHQRGAYRISTDSALMDVDAVHAYLARSYWARDIPKDVVAKSMRGSLCFGLFENDVQIGLGRVVTDRATFAYLTDVYVLEEHRGRGLGQWLIEVIVNHPDLRGLRRFVLATRDAHKLYEKFAFTPLASPEWFMEIRRPT